jgi:hypothetical protein
MTDISSQVERQVDVTVLPSPEPPWVHEVGEKTKEVTAM